MGLGKLLSFKRSKPKEDVLEEKKDVPIEKQEIDPPKINNANIVYPFHDVKATSFPPPLSIDASVFTDANNLTVIPSENEKIIEIPDKNGNQAVQKDEKPKEDKIEGDKKRSSIEYETCDSKTCTKEKCTPATCGKGRNNGTHDTSFKKQNDVADKIGQDKLTEIINSSIKEAMQTIVKQCRMDEEKGEDKKQKDDKLICHTKSKSEYRSRQRSPESGLKPSHFREKQNAVRSKRLHEGKVKGHDKKSIELEEARSKKRSKLANNVRTDNRRMTGNVNIYICSEANENTQPSKSKKPQQPCTESSSETTTDRSNVSSSKLVTCIRNKRRKLKEQHSLDLLPKKDESSDNSNISSLVAKSTDSNIATGEESNDFLDVCKEISEKDTESSLTECECKDTSNSDATIDTSDLSFRKSKFIACNNIEKPCSTIYPSKIHSDSDEWSSKSICSSRNDDYTTLDRQIVLCDKKRDHLEFDYRNYYRDSKDDYEDKKKFIKTCRCRKQNRKVIGNGRCTCGENRQRVMEKESFVQPLSTCSCIAEEEEEDVCMDAETCKKATEKPVSVCGDVSEGLEESVEKFVACTSEIAEESKKGKEEGKAKAEKEEKPEVVEKEEIDVDVKTKETEEEKKEVSETVPPLSPQKLIRPEVLVLRSILRQQAKPTAQVIDQTNTNPAPATEINSPENKTNSSSNNPSNPQTKIEPAFLKRFNLREQHKFIRTDVEDGQPPSQKPEDKVSEVKGNEEDTDTRKTFQERVKNTFLYKSLKRILEKRESPGRKSETDKEKDTIGEDTKDSTDKKTEASKTSTDGDKLPDSKDTKEKEKFVPRMNIYKMMKTKKNKSETNVTPQKIVKTDADFKPVESKNIKEKTKDAKKEETSVIPEQEDKTKLLSTMIKDESPPPLIKDTKIEETKQVDSQSPQKVSESQEHSKKIGPSKDMESRGPPKTIEIPKKLNDKETKEPGIKRSVIEETPKKIDPHFETPTVCVQCVRRKSLNKESKQCSQIHVSEPHTTCVNPKFVRCTDPNESYAMDNKRFDEGRCNCCCLPISQCTNEFINHPKSCLKKPRQVYCTNSQETSAPILCYDKRNWEGCECRRVLFCEGCRRPRTECSCRFTYVPCTNCCEPRSKCSCKLICKSRSTCGHMRSMFCLYCDSPRENCTCRAPLRKCPYCELSMDLCRCEDQKTICDGRPVPTEADNDRTMYVTAWKPREEIRRYFSRNLDVLRTDSINECWCHEKLKHHKSDDLPYQRLSVFSDVMDELQQKLSESTCCTRCRKIPCCCNANEGKIKCCVSPKSRRKLAAMFTEKPKVKSSNNHKRDSVREKSDRPRKIIVSLCCECNAAPCRCKKSKSNQKKPRAKCYYCKNSPCICIATGECNKPRPCRCNDSPCHTKEKENALRGKTSTKPKNNDEKIICVR